MKSSEKITEIKFSRKIVAAVMAVLYLAASSPVAAFAEEVNAVSNPVSRAISVSTEEKSEVLISAKTGGTVKLGDASIEIPEGALKEDTRISITRLLKVSDTGESLYNATAESGGYRFLPAGTKFEKDVVITLPYNAELDSKPQTIEELYTYFYDTQKKSWVKLERLEVDKVQHKVRSLTNHFTDMINATLTLPESASPVDVNLNSIKNLEAAKPDGHLIKFNPPKASNTGDASFSFELAVPAGRRGMQPQISVSYSSGGGNGIMGKGFDVSYGSSITTDTRFGLPNYDTHDTYTLDGILLEEKSRRGTTITYAPQRETSFSRVVRYDAGTESDHWEVTDKSGTKRIYAQEFSSCVGSGAKTFTWYLTKVEDVHGNCVIYEYKKSDGYVYPKEIFYTGFGSKKGNYKVQFHYDENSAQREDVRIDARSREIVACKKLLTGITSHYKNGNAIRTYSFEYTEGLAKEKMLTVLRVSNNAGESYEYTFSYTKPLKDKNGNVIYFADAAEWKNGSAIKTGKSDSGGGSFNTSAGVGVGDVSGAADVRLTGGVQGSISESHSETESTLFDIDGDGSPDYVRVSGGTLFYRLNTKHGFDDEKKVSLEKFKLDDEESQNLSLGWNIYGGGGVNKAFVSGLGMTYSEVYQTTSSKTTAALSDADGDRKTDIILSGKNYYLKNTSDGKNIRFEKAYYDSKNSSAIKNNIKKITQEEVNRYKEAYKIQTPFRQWKAPYDGTLSVSQKISAAENFGKSNSVKAHVYKGNSDIALSSLESEVSSQNVEVASNTKTVIEQNENLYFITETDEPLGSDVSYNIEINYTDLKAYKPQFPEPEFFPQETFSTSYAKNESTNAEAIAKKIIPEELFELYSINVSKEKNSDDDKLETVTCTLKENWKESATEEAFDYLIAQSRFLPGAFTESQFEKIFERFKKHSAENSSANSVTNNDAEEYAEFASNFIYDITCRAYIIRDNTDKDFFNSLYDELNAKDIIRESWKNYTRFEIEARYSKSEFSYGQKSDEVSTGLTRSKTTCGTQIENGNKIILGKLNEKTLSVSKKDNKVFLNEEEIPDFSATFKTDEEDKTLTVTIIHNLNGEKLVYKFSNLKKKAFNMTKEEMQSVVDDFKTEGESPDDAYWNWKEKPEADAVNQLCSYGMDDDQQKKFLELVFEKTEKESDEVPSDEKTEPAKITVFSKKEKISEENFKEASSILANVKFKKVTENDFPFYALSENGYELKAEYASDVSENDSDERKAAEQLIIAECSAHGLGKYCSVQVSSEYDCNGLYNLNGSGEFSSIRISENSFDVEEEYFSPGQTEWNSFDAWNFENTQNANNAGNKILYEEKTADKETVITIERCEKLFAGNINWFFGIWTGDVSSFTGEKIESILSSKNPSDYENKYDSELKNMSEEEAASKKGQNEDQPFYIPLVNVKQDGSDVYPVKKEAASEKEVFENSLIGQVSISCKKTELSDGSSRMETQYYFPFFQGDYIHAGRVGGNSFYSIEGLVQDEIQNSSSAQTGEKNSTFNFPFVRMARNEGTDRTYGINADTSLANIEILKDVGELNLNLLAKISQGIGSNTGTNENSGKLTQTVTDINGDSIPDIIQATDSGIKVFAGKKSGTASDSSLSYAEEYEVSGIKINSTHSTMNVNGASFSPGGSVSLEFNKGKPSHVKLSAGTSGGGGKSSAEGSSSVDAGLIDINGDGLPDYFNGSSVLLNKGKEFEPSNLISVSAGSMSESSISSYAVNANVGKSSTHGESLVTGVSFGGGLSYSVSSNTTKKMFLDINGDGLCDRVEQNAGAISVFYNTGNSFVKSDNVQLPSWNLDDSQNASLVTGKDADFELGQFGSLPLIGQVTEQLVNVLPVCNPFAPEEIDSMEFSSTISLSVSGNAGVNFTFPIKIPVATISVNMTCSGGNGLSGSSSINAVNVSMTDLDGDGLPDHVLRIPGHATYWKRNISGSYGQLTGITLPQGGSVQIEYAEKYGTTDSPNFKYVMSRVIVSDGCGETVPEINHGSHKVGTNYEYDGAYYDREQRDFFGFRTVTTTFADGTYTIDEYCNREYYLKGAVEKSCSYAKDGTVLSIHTAEYCDAPCALTAKEENWTYEKASGNTDCIHTVAHYEYDEYGNCKRVTQDFGDSESLTGEIIYDNSNVADYIIGLPADIYVYGTDGELLRHRSGSYDGKGQLTELRQYFDRYNWSSSFLSYDKFGNIKSVSDSRGATIAYTYDEDENMFVSEISQYGKDTDTYRSFIDYDIATQTKTRETDCNGNTLRYEYDGWQRVKKIFTSYDTTVPAVSYEYFTSQKNADSFCDLWYAITSNKVTFDSDDDSVIQTVMQIDGLGRAVRTAKTGFVNGIDGWNASGAVEYDEKGRTVKAGMTEFIAGDLESLLSSRPKMTDLFSSYEYDEKDRQIRTILPDGSVQENRFYIEENKLISETTDPLGNVSLQETDSRGNIVRVSKFDKDGAQLTEVTYRYNELGEMLNAFDARGNPISVEYDLLGRRTALESLDSGRQEFFYDECSNLVRENNSVLKENNKQIVYEYDGLNRLVRIDYPDTEDTVYTYGGASDTLGAAGKIRSITDASGTLEYEYGKLGEVTKETRTLATHLNRNNPTETAVMEYRSDYLGRMQWIVYPDGEKITYGYDNGGQVVSVTGEHYGYEFKYVTNILYDEYGQRTRIDYGNGTFTEYTYDPARRWLDTIKTENKWGQSYQNMTYSFDAVGNVLGYENDCLDSVTGNYKTKQTYSYDNLYQLIKVDGETVYNPYLSSVPEFISSYSQVFSFDTDGLGNMTSKVSKETVTPQKSIGDNLNYSFDYVYDENFAHRLLRAGDRYYKYDENGNIICEQDGSFEGNGEDVSYHKITQEAENVYSTDYGWGLLKEDNSSSEIKGSRYCRAYIWNERNQLISSVDSNYSTAYVYGQDGQRSNKYTQNSETLYFNKMWTLHTDSGNNVYGGQTAKNIYLGETRIVTKLNSGENPTYQEEYYKQYYYHSDHLGSASLISDYKGDEYQRIEYTPYGETWVEKTQNTGLEFLPYRFTGKEIDEETGLYYYGARYLDPKYSMWISTDPALGEYIPNAPINEEAKRYNQNLPGMGGVYNHINFNLYHYVGNNPIKYIDPDGNKVKTTDSSVMNDAPQEEKLGFSDYTIKSSGCVLTAYYRMAVKLGYTGSLIDANEFAKSKNLFSGALLTIENGVKLVNGLLEKEGILTRIGYSESITGSIQEIALKLNKIDAIPTSIFVSARIMYNPDSKMAGGGHTMNIPANPVFINDIYDMDNCFGINFLDTYSNWIQTTNDKDSKHFSLIRADVFIIYYSSWRQMTNVESQDD